MNMLFVMKMFNYIARPVTLFLFSFIRTWAIFGGLWEGDQAIRRL
jgi:hypothetical protein